MKVREIKADCNREEKPFPKLMIARGRIILFEEYKKGVVIKPQSGSSDYIGQYWTDWNMKNFTDYEGTLEISND